MNILHHSMKKLVMLCAASLFALHAAADDFEIDGICYTCDDLSSSTTCSVTSGGNYTGNVVIPETVTYEGRTMTVAAIGIDAFSYCSDLTQVILGNSITAIEKYAFYDCTGLTEINIPESVTSIGTWAFYNCTSLTEVYLPESVTTYGSGVFWDCTALEKVNIPKTVTTIADDMFTGCSSLTQIDIPESVTAIGRSAFSYCTGLTEVYIPESVTAIGGSAFANCTGLTQINIPESVTELEISVFDSCTGLTEINIPETVTYIDDYAFYGCTGLTSINIPNSVTTIAYEAFYGCTGLTQVILNSVDSVGYRVFYGCPDIAAIYSWNPEPPIYISSSDDDSFFSENVYEDATLYIPTGSLSAYRTADVWKYFQTIVETDGTETGIAGTQADTRTEVYAGNGRITVSGATGIVRVYDMSGTLLRSARGDGSRLELALPSGRIYIVEAGGQATKVAL